MIENLKRIREPLTWAVLAVVVANMVLGILALVNQVRDEVPLFEAFQSIGGSLLNISLVIALVALVCTCFFITPATRRANLVTLVTAVVLSLGVLLTLVSYVLGAAAAQNPFSRGLEIIGGLLDLVLKAIAAGALWVLLRGVTAGRIDTALPAEAVDAEPLDASAPAGAGGVIVESKVDPVSEESRTIWPRSEAAGSAWHTADDAAQGAPGVPRLAPDQGSAVFRDEVVGRPESE